MKSFFLSIALLGIATTASAHSAKQHSQASIQQLDAEMHCPEKSSQNNRMLEFHCDSVSIYGDDALNFYINRVGRKVEAISPTTERDGYVVVMSRK